ncbi:hypothetical protein MMC12_007868 [Toensbergia leucococca]|nr:hypothetical protein [Toensbergia leucococca]
MTHNQGPHDDRNPQTSGIVNKVPESSSSSAADSSTAHSTPRQHEIEDRLVAEGKMRISPPEKERQPGEEDEAGNKIHHKGLFGHVLHWEADAVNK